MRICMVTSAPLPPAEGIGYYVWNLSRFLMQQGHGVQIITRGQHGRPSYEEWEGIPVWRPRFYRLYPLHVHLHGLFVQRLVRRLEPKVDVFHLHSPLPPPIRSQRPLLVTAHTSRVGAARVIRVRDLSSLLARLQVPVSIAIERKLFASADQIAVVAQSVAAELRSYGLWGKPIAVLGNGVDTHAFCAGRQGSEVRPDEMYVLAAGRLTARKGFEDLLDAMGQVVRQFPMTRLVIAGAGPLEQLLRTKAEQMALDGAVRFLGHVEERTRMIELYRRAVLFAHASHYEGLPTVLLEAMACGKAVVCTAVSGALDVIEDRVNGLLTSPGAPGQLAEAVCCLLGDTQLRARLGKAARHTVEQRFSWQAVGSAHVRSYESLLNGMGTRSHWAKATSSDLEPPYA